jgi:hypothetical protein
VTTVPDSPNPQPAPQKQSFVSDWAKRSSGVEGDVTPLKPTSERDAQDNASLWRLAGLGFQIGVTLAVFIIVGYFIDLHFHWGYAGVLTGAVIAIVGSMYLLIKEARKLLK